MTRAIQKHLRDFALIAALALAGLAVGGFILYKQRAALPEWVPFFGSDRFELRAEFTSAQAVTPGQGQTVNIAGIRVGDVTKVELDDGAAVVTMAVEQRYAPLIHPDASLLLRPRSGLNDMTIDVDPGTGTRQIREGSTVPLSSTQPNVQPDEILATLDGDTRQFLQLLLAAGGEGLGGRGEKLSADLRRLEPTARDLARVNGALATRRHNLRRVVHNFGLLSQELSRHDQELAGFVESSDAVFQAFARQQAALQAALREFPSALDSTRTALASSDKLSVALAPALRDLTPAAEALGPALRQTRPLFRHTTGPIRNQIRPFTRQVSKPVEHIADASRPLAQTSTGLTGAFGRLDQLLNILAYDPPGSDQSFLFFLSWLGHNTNSLFLNQDANGPLLRGLVLQSCGTAIFAEGVASTVPFLRTLQQLTNVPKSTQIAAAGGC